MGMHDIEYTVQYSVECLDKSPRASELDCRSLFKSLYAFQREYDTGSTYFRVTERLVRRRFFYAFKLEEHPDFDRCGYNLSEPGGPEDILCVYRDPSKPWDRDNNPSVGCVLDFFARDGRREDLPRELAAQLSGKRIYFDAGSELWRRFVEAGKLTGSDAVEPRSIPADEVVATVVTEAEQQQNVFLIRIWLAVLCWHMRDVPLEELKQNPFVRTLRTVARRTGALALVDSDLDWGHWRIPQPDDSYLPLCAEWWFDLDCEA